jgi:hypothetical protein
VQFGYSNRTGCVTFHSFPLQRLTFSKKQRFLEMRPSSGLSCSQKWKCTAHPTLILSIYTFLPSMGITSPSFLHSLLRSMRTKLPRPKMNPPTRGLPLQPRPEKWMLNPTLLEGKREKRESNSPLTFLRSLPPLLLLKLEAEKSMAVFSSTSLPLHFIFSFLVISHSYLYLYFFCLAFCSLLLFIYLLFIYFWVCIDGAHLLH